MYNDTIDGSATHIPQETTMSSSGSLGVMTCYAPTYHLRWTYSTSTTIIQLEQAWLCSETGGVEWRPIPIVKV